LVFISKGFYGKFKSWDKTEIFIMTKKTIDAISMNHKPVMPAEPAALGLIGLAVAALVIGSGYLGLTSGTDKLLMVPWVLFFGATAQIIAGITDFKRNNVFGATVFSTYAMTMYAIAFTLLFTIFGGVSFDITHYAFGLIAILIFSVIATVASMMTNKVLFSILIVVDIAVAGLIPHYLTGASSLIGGIFLLATSALSFYAAASILLNSIAGKTVLPLGKPIWKP
jgi:succinate-acetate transporter protein